MTLDVIKQQIRVSIDTKEKLISDDALMNGVLALSEKCAAALRAGGKILRGLVRRRKDEEILFRKS